MTPGRASPPALALHLDSRTRAGSSPRPISVGKLNNTREALSIARESRRTANVAHITAFRE